MSQDQCFSLMNDDILQLVLSLSWENDIVDILARKLGVGNDPAELKLIKVLRALAAVRKATGLPLFADADKVVDLISSKYLRTVDQGARNWESINQIVSEFLLREHARHALARISRLAEPDSLLIFPSAFESRMTTSAKLMAEFSEGIIGPMLKAFFDKEITNNRGNDAWREQREWRKRQGADFDLLGKQTRTESEPQPKTKQQGEPTGNKTDGSLKCFYFLRRGSCNDKRCKRLHEPAAPGEKCPFSAKGQCRLMEKCLLAATHEK